VVIFDEGDSGLGAPEFARLLDLFRDQDRGLVVITHDLELASRVADATVRLQKEGRLNGRSTCRVTAPAPLDPRCSCRWRSCSRCCSSCPALTLLELTWEVLSLAIWLAWASVARASAADHRPLLLVLLLTPLPPRRRPICASAGSPCCPLTVREAARLPFSPTGVILAFRAVAARPVDPDALAFGPPFGGAGQRPCSGAGPELFDHKPGCARLRRVDARFGAERPAGRVLCPS
jgi:energy-coupling factor transporter ATP-binding protein EcfA2